MVMLLKFSLPICYEIVSLLYTVDSLVSIRLIDKERYECHCLRKLNF